MSLFYKRATLYILLVSTIAMIVLLLLQGRPLHTAATPHGIISLEFAATATAVEAVLESWSEAALPGQNIITIAENNTWLDFIFLFCYSLFLFTAARQLSTFFSAKKLFNTVGYAALLSGILDIAENIGMLRSLQGSINDTTAFMTAIAAYFKWIIVLAVLLFLLAGFILKLVNGKRGGDLN
ncbi:MAG: hypothetical protein H7Y86_02455 [Rhizobacter sp.]|nr:hypothetical protein [Ferruginibacter sp.]